ncbi:N-acetyltransferase [Thalassobaculum sp. OXR-137]|uniref:GNAT family N-acetyltransferase n=1 Tax=Thalassobaculum sp. OXR-137 TaxID=3100173 RepID=UPI002AC9E67E|nr:N-acetyltransferase [Thalassobaculum sp. OXR-137]WPZ35510.1 N-acetyltransferase [Thalassobaculum sp. OXR-137]
MTGDQTQFAPQPVTLVEHVTELSAGDLNDLCDAAEAAIIDGGGFGWLTPPPRETLEAYWRGTLLIPDRDLFVGRLDGVIAGSSQLHRPPRNNEAQSFACNFTTSFVAPWARGHGLARDLTQIAENHARKLAFEVMNLDVRETQRAAIRLYEALGFQKFGEHPYYARTRDGFVRGLYYFKNLTATAPEGDAQGGAS